jgi:hypothetical protein
MLSTDEDQCMPPAFTPGICRAITQRLRLSCQPPPRYTLITGARPILVTCEPPPAHAAVAATLVKARAAKAAKAAKRQAAQQRQQTA